MMSAGTMAGRASSLRKLAAGSRPHRALPVHDRVDDGPRRGSARPRWLEQGGGAPCPQARHQLPPTRRTVGPNRGGAALPESADGSSHRASRAPCRSSAPGGRRAVWRRREPVREGDVGRDVDLPPEVPGRVEASVSTASAGAPAASSTATPTAARPGRPRVAASSSTSAGIPPGPPAAAAEVGVPRSRPLPRGARVRLEREHPTTKPAAQRITSCALSPRLATDGADGLGIGNDQLCDRGRHSRERSQFPLWETLHNGVQWPPRGHDQC